MKTSDRIREMIAQEAARLMYEEGIREYRDAKRKAARRFGPEKALSLGSHLPTNAEIHGELQRLIHFHEGRALPERIFRLRMLALSYMELLAPFTPYLVGSVLSGAVTTRSDIDLHLFAESPEEVEDHLNAHDIPYEFELVTIRRGGDFTEYPHLYLEEDGTVIECTVYPPEDRHRIPRSSITGKPMARADAGKLKRLIGEMMAVGKGKEVTP